MMDETKKKVVRPKTQVRRLGTQGLLSEGDDIELSITAEVKTKQGRTFWVKGGARSTIRPGEGDEDGAARVAEFVTGYVDAQITDYLA